MDPKQVGAMVERVRHFSDFADLARVTARVHRTSPLASNWSVHPGGHSFASIPLLTKTLAVPRGGFTRALRWRPTGRSTLASFLCFHSFANKNLARTTARVHRHFDAGGYLPLLMSTWPECQLVRLLFGQRHRL
jgi:hypothetical protein